MGELQIPTLAPNPNLKPSPFPNWKKPPHLNALKYVSPTLWPNFFNSYRILRKEKEYIKYLANLFGTVDIKNLAKCAANESKNGMWKVASHTFEEVILHMQNIDQSNKISVKDRDFLWIDISISLREAGFFEQARCVLQNINNEFYALAEARLLDNYIANENIHNSKSEPKYRSNLPL